MSNLFKTLEQEAFRKGITPRTKESIKWFRQKAREMFRGRNIKGSTIMLDDEVTLKGKPKTSHKGVVGNMYAYFYDPKHKKTLPYYDGFPLIIMLGPAKGGFYGLNIHYLPPVLRAKVLDAILGGQPVPQKFYKPMIHRYLFKHVRSRFALIDEKDYEIATFLPTADWNNADGKDVYKDSRKKMNS